MKKKQKRKKEYFCNMTNASAIQIIRSSVRLLFPEARILLFGSMARNDSCSNSDYDVLIITKQHFLPKEKISWVSQIHKVLVYSLNAPVDVLLNSEEEVNSKKNLPGHVVRWALKEGVEL